MQTNSTTQTKTAATIPAHVMDRLENEWRQMRQGNSQPSSQNSSK